MSGNYCPNCCQFSVSQNICPKCQTDYADNKLGILFHSYAQRRLVKTMLPSIREVMPGRIPLQFRDAKAPRPRHKIL